MTKARWQVLALVGSLAACAHPPPGYFFPTAREPYRVTFRENPQQETVTITVVAGPRRSPVNVCLYGTRAKSDAEGGQVVSDFELTKRFKDGSIPTPAGDSERGGGGYTPDDSGWWSYWSEAERQEFQGVAVELSFADLRLYGPVLYLQLNDFANTETGDFPASGPCRNTWQKMVTYELHQLEPLHARLQAKNEQSPEFKAHEEEAGSKERSMLARRREIAEHLAEEVKTGTCHPENEALYQTFLTQQVPIIAHAMERPAVSDIGPHRIVVATDTPGTYSFEATLGGIYHVFAMGIEEVRLDEVRDGNGNRATARSPYVTGFLTGGFPMEAVMARARPMQEITATVRGHGCTLIFTINQVGE